MEAAGSRSGEFIEAGVEMMRAVLDGSLVAWLGHLETTAATVTPDTRG